MAVGSPPWTVHYQGHNRASVRDADGYDVCVVAKPSAALVSAAPDLLAALKDLRAEMATLINERRIYLQDENQAVRLEDAERAAGAAIRKATTGDV